MLDTRLGRRWIEGLVSRRGGGEATTSPNEALSRMALLLIPPIVWLALVKDDLFTLYQVQSQDFAVLLALPLMLLVLAHWAPPWSLPAKEPRPLLLLAIGVALVPILAWGSYVLMGDFPISRDEHMVVFDMAVFANGDWAAPLGRQWREYDEALVPAFLLESVAPEALVSGYLPVNAALRLAFSKLANPAFFNPALALIGGVALWQVARREMADDHRARLVVLLIYLTSTQMLAAAMTTYAMTAHMALNMIWLWAFLRGGRVGHAIALSTAFLAIGLHQVVFHALFVAPFLLWRIRAGEWRIALLYGVAYMAIAGWWVSYSGFVAARTGIGLGVAHEASSFFVEKLQPLLLQRDPKTLPLMLLNVLRFVAWQNLALLLLLAFALPFAWRDRGIGGPLTWGIAGALLTFALILPYQGHGWGYRYLHPMLGSFALLAGIGYQRLAARCPGRADAIVLASTALTLAGSLPLLLGKTYAFVAPHVAVERIAAGKTADFLIIDTEVSPTTDGRWAANAIDHVRNDPYLKNYPLRFSSRHLDRSAILELCRRGSIAFLTRAEMHRAGFAMNVPTRSPRFEAKVRSLPNESCGASRNTDLAAKARLAPSL